MSATELRNVHTERGARLRERREIFAHLDSATAEELRALVQVDALTGALARDYGLTHADRAEFLSLIDLDGFKAVNDVHGHAAGDVVLATVARRLSTLGTVVRLGGDEFLLCTDSAPDADELELLVSAPVSLDMHGTHATVGASVGTVDQSDHPESVEDALEAADALMYASKTERRVDRRRAGR